MTVFPFLDRNASIFLALFLTVSQFATLAVLFTYLHFTRLYYTRYRKEQRERKAEDMAKRDSLTVWLPKEMYGSVEPLADDRFIWCPMPFDNSLPVEQTSFIDMGGDDEDNNNKEPARSPGNEKPMIDYDLPAPPPAAVLTGPSMDISTSETESEREFPMRQISQNLGRGRRRSRKTRSARQQQHKHAGSESRGFAVHLGLNLDIEVTLKARIFGDLEISAL